MLCVGMRKKVVCCCLQRKWGVALVKMSCHPHDSRGGSKREAAARTQAALHTGTSVPSPSTTHKAASKPQVEHPVAHPKAW